MAHINYIQYRPGEDRDKDIQRSERGEDEDYDAGKEPSRPLRVAGDDKDERPGKSAQEFKDALQNPDERGRFVHKFILSPSEKDVDMDTYTQEVMNSIGQNKGQDLRYAWVVHDNTENRHAHVVVLGKDEEGHQVKFNRTDHSFMRAYGDRYLEREHGIEMHFDRDIEMQARIHGHNLYLSDRDQNARFLDQPYSERSFKRDEDFQHLLNINKNWAESLEGPSREGGLQLGSTWLHDRGRFSEVHDLFQNTANRDLWNDVKNNCQDEGLKDYAGKQLESLAEQRQGTVLELQNKLGLSPEKFDDFIKGIQEQFAQENREIDQVLHPEKYMPQEYEHKDIDTSKIADKDLIQLKNGDVLSKYDSADYLNGSRISLNNGPYEDRISREDFGKLCSWIGTKEQHGENCFGDPPLKERELEYERSLDPDQIPDARSIDSISMEASLDTKAMQDLLRPYEQQEIAPPDLGLEKLELGQDIEESLQRDDPMMSHDDIEFSMREQDEYQTNYDIDYDDSLDIGEEFELDFNDDRDQDKGREQGDEPGRGGSSGDHERGEDRFDEVESICDIDQVGGDHSHELPDDTDRADDRTNTDDNKDRSDDRSDDENKRGDRGDR
jgi:hypothetical protein